MKFIGQVSNDKDLITKSFVLSLLAGYQKAGNFLTSVPSEYITESELNARNFLERVPDEYVTDSELAVKGYLTQSTANNLYATKQEVPKIQQVTQSQYDSMSKDNNTLYVIVG